MCTDAYLSPIVHDYVQSFHAGFDVPPQRVEFMSSDGGLRKAHKYTGNAALLSGPAGGVVGVARSCFDIEDQKAVIGFDMVRTTPAAGRFRGGCLRSSRVVRAPMFAAMTGSLTISPRRPSLAVKYRLQC